MPVLSDIINVFRPVEFTFDQYESSHTIQVLNEDLRQRGISETKVYPIFATAKVNEQRAKNFRTAINLGRVHAPHPTTIMGGSHNSLELVRNELKFLQEKNGKVDRQTVGPVQTKDIADCMMAVTQALIGDSIINAYGNLENSVPQFGSQGGYSLGSQGNTTNFPEFAELYTHHAKNSRIFVPGRGIKRRGR
jgi:hypothetical protein